MLRRRWLIVAVGVAALAAGLLPVVLLAAVSGGSRPAGASTCTPTSVSGVPTTAAGLSGVQLGNAGIIIATGRAMNIPDLGEVDAVTAAITESRLINLPAGDADSAGLFQERPSQGWGTYAQVTNPVYASTQFYLRLTALPGWQQMDPATAAQAVERSAFPGRYQANVPLATLLVANASPAGTGPILINNCAPTGTVPLGPGGANLPAEVVAQIEASPPQVVVAIRFALAQLGKPYVWGATGPDAFDCSGLTQAAYRAAGISLPRTTYEEVMVGLPVNEGQLLPGDLVLPDPGHIQMYLGGGLVVEAPHSGAFVQVIGLWGFWQARRVV